MIRRRNGRRRGAVKESPKLKMTSMMDILTVLLLFLLKSFVVDAEVVTPPPGVELPHSTAETPPEAALVVAISDDTILVGAKPVTTVAEAMAGSGLLIEPLEKELLAELARMDEIATRRGRDEAAGQITIQGDKDVEFRLLQRIMYTCGFAGFDEMALAVIREARGA